MAGVRQSCALCARGREPRRSKYGGPIKTVGSRSATNVASDPALQRSEPSMLRCRAHRPRRRAAFHRASPVRCADQKARSRRPDIARALKGEISRFVKMSAGDEGNLVPPPQRQKRLARLRLDRPIPGVAFAWILKK